MGIERVIFASFYHCQYKAFLKATRQVGLITDYELVQAEADDRFKDEAIERLVRQNGEEQAIRQPRSLSQAIEAKSNLIIGATAEAMGMVITFDALERLTARHEDPVYVPILFFHKERLAKEDSLLATLHGIVLAEALGQSCPFVKVVHGAGFSLTRIKLNGPSGPSRLATKTRQILDRLRRQIESTSAPLMVLNSHCPSCEFRDRCRAEAVAKDDLSLMRSMSEKEILAQRKHGINTVAQFASTFRPKSIGIKRIKPPKRHLHALQALAVRDKKVYVVRTPELPTRAARVYLDVEGLPDRDFYYLVGVVVENDGQRSVHSFWADDEKGERTIWSELIDLLCDMGDCTLFHYGSYEKTYIARMLRKYPCSDAPFAGTWDSASFNVLGAIRTNVYFPAYSNGLKDIASFLGANWGGILASGIECIARRLRWEESRDLLIKEEIIEYNRQDCLATQRIVDFLFTLSPPQGSATPGIQLASTISVESHRRFGKIEFAVPEMNMINKCARFDYQREKVLLRTDPAVRASVRRSRVKSRPVRKANTEVLCAPPARCPACGATRPTSFRRTSDSKLVYDLKFTRTGVKRWVVRYVTGRSQCLGCRKSFYSDSYPTHQKTGHGLASWAVYNHVALRLSFCDVTSSINELFRYSLSEPTGRRAQSRLAGVYRETQEKMMEQLRSGMLIHADETKVSIKGGMTGYVWAFSGPETVVYLYSPTREGTFLKDSIQDFSGVLVSDFYSAYDSVKCPQQKCHLHLMRDLNDDLLQNPFDDDLKELARRYTLILKSIVVTIDKHGLQTKYLSKHQRDAQTFLDWVAGRAVHSDAAEGYKSRIDKYGERLFTFLGYDGVPWNNNNAENAIKLVASRRRLFGTSVSESGLKDYLVFLSIYQTLRRKGFSLLKFLLSGEKQIEKFVASPWSR